jgi:hypothetical protein
LAASRGCATYTPYTRQPEQGEPPSFPRGDLCSLGNVDRNGERVFSLTPPPAVVYTPFRGLDPSPQARQAHLLRHRRVPTRQREAPTDPRQVPRLRRHPRRPPFAGRTGRGPRGGRCPRLRGGRRPVGSGRPDRSGPDHRPPCSQAGPGRHGGRVRDSCGDQPLRGHDQQGPLLRVVPQDRSREALLRRGATPRRPAFLGRDGPSGA